MIRQIRTRLGSVSPLSLVFACQDDLICQASAHASVQRHYCIAIALQRFCADGQTTRAAFHPATLHATIASVSAFRTHHLNERAAEQTAKLPS